MVNFIEYSGRRFESEILSQDELDRCLELLKKTDPKSAPFLADITREITKDPRERGVTSKGREVKKFFEFFHLELSKSHIYRKKTDEVEITEEHIATIRNNLNRISKPLELTQIVFNNPNLTPLSVEHRALRKFIETEFKFHLSNNYVDFEDDEFDEKYEPPKTPLNAYREAKNYVKGLDVSEDSFPKSKYYYWMSKLRDYLQDDHFIHHINHNIKKPSKRKLFLSQFISYTYDKPDLTEEEKEQYIELCAQTIMADDYYQMMLEMNEKIKNILDDDDKYDLRMSLVEHKKDVNNNYNAAVKRKQDLMKSLNGTRAERLKNQTNQSMSFVQLLNYWREEENREKMIKVAEARREKIEHAFEELSDCDHLIAEIYGSGTIDDILSS